MRQGRRRQEQARGGFTAYLAGDRVTAEERGWIVLALVGHAVAFLMLTAAETVWVAVVGARAWRRREAGLAGAVRASVHKPTLAALLAVHLLYGALRRAGVAKLNRRISESTDWQIPPTRTLNDIWPGPSR